MATHEIGDLIAGTYRIVGVGGGTDAARRYEAEAMADGARVEIVALAQSAAGRYREAQRFERLAAVEHPGLLRYHALLAGDDGAADLVREHVAGTSLASLVASAGKGTESLARSVAREVLSVLRALHGAARLVHGDVRPSNVLRREDGRFVLVEHGAGDEATGREGGALGYLAPEQFRGTAVPASDLYGLGATLTFLLGGRSPAELPQVGLRVDVRSLEGVSAGFRAWLRRMLEPDPRRRFSSAGAALAALEASAPERRRARLAGLGAGLGLTVAAGVVVLVLALRDRARADALGAAAPAGAVAGDAGSFVRPVAFISQPGPVFGLAFDAEGRRVAALSRTGSLQLHDLERNAVEATFDAGHGMFAGLALSADDATLVAGARSSLLVFAVEGHALLAELPSGKAQVRDVCLSSDGSRAATGGDDGVVRVWDLRSRKQLFELPHGGGVIALAMSADGARVFSAGRSGAVRIWDAAAGTPLATLDGHVGAISDLALSADGERLLSAGDDHTVKVWRVAARALEATLEGHLDEVWAVAVSPDGRMAVSGDKADVIRTWELPSGRSTGAHAAGLHAVTKLAWSPDGKRYAAAGGGNDIRLWHAPGRYWRPPLPPADYRRPAVELPPPASPEEGFVREAMTLLDAGQDEEPDALRRARAAVDKALAARPDYAPAHVALARTTLLAGYQHGTSYDPASVARAHQQIDRALALDPTSSRAWLVKGWAFADEKNFGDARAMVAKALELDPKSARAQLLVAHLDRTDGRYEDAIAAARIAVESTDEPNVLSEAYGELGHAYRSLEAWDAAEDTYVAQMRLTPRSAWVRGNYARFLIRLHRYDEAIARAKEALERMNYPAGRKALGDAYAGRAFQHLAKKDFDRAQELLELARTEGGDTSRVAATWGFYFKARALADHDRELLARAKAAFERALVLEPDYESVKAALRELPALEEKLR
ncbi:MAG: hypothetical protein HY908_24510 [Myxococcales bacterium]|nr:hypothetical protein [Myxococcales bacterium]